MSDRFPFNSRYAETPTAARVTRDGETVVYLRRRFVPPATAFAVLEEHTVSEGERLDHLAAGFLGDAEQFWRLCDANDALEPSELERPGRVLRITLPAGIPGGTDA